MKNQNNKVWVSGPKRTSNIKYLPSIINKILWLAILLLLALAVVGGAYLSEVVSSHAIRVAIIIVAVIVLLLVARATNQGKKSWHFILDSRLEMHKVSWPTRQETVTSTLIVLAIVVIASLIIAFAGYLFMKFVAGILG